MTEKQNALEILRFGKPQRVACGLPSYSVYYLGANHQGYGDTALSDGHQRPGGGQWSDIWGTLWVKQPRYPTIMGFPKGNPLAQPCALAHYSWPNPNDERICAPIYRQAEAFTQRDTQFLVGSHRDTLWEKSYMLVGMENMMEYFYTEPSYAREILHRIMDFQMGIAAHYAKIGVEMVSMSDDMGTQSSLLLGKKVFDEFLLPEYERLFAFYRARGVLINFHSCGHVLPLLESFISLGVNVLNPVQATANNLRDVIAVTQGRMALMGGVSSHLIMRGTPEQITEAVKNAIALLGKNAGYFCSPDQHMPFPEDNLDTFYKAVSQFGSYPLQ